MNKLFNERNWYYGLHDAVYDSLDFSLSEKELRVVFCLLPFDLQAIANEWGTNDTEFRDGVITYLETSVLPELLLPDVMAH